MARIAKDDDLLIVNRNGVDCKATVAEVMPSVCELEELPDVAMPWDDADAIYHIITKPGFSVGVAPRDYDKIYHKESQTEVSEISLGVNEWIVTGVNTKFGGTQGEVPGDYDTGNTNTDFAFGPLTNTSAVTDMSHLLNNCKNFRGEGLQYFDVSNVTDMRFMFYSCVKMFEADLSGWATGNVKNMSHMFCMSYLFNSDISGWDTSNVTNMDLIFNNTDLFNQDLSGWCVNPEPSHVSFDFGANGWDKPRPVWGTCPRGENTP